MRTSLALALALAACGGGSTGGDDDPTPDGGNVDPPPPERGFRIQTPDIEIMPGEEVTYCYYFRTPNTESMAIKNWKSNMTPGSHHMIYFATSSDAGEVGSFERDCEGFGTQGGGTIWTYSAGTPQAEIALPADDGTGKPLAQVIPANSAGFFQMHYLNASDQAIQAHVTLDATALEADVAFTQTAAFITYNSDIDIPGNATNHVESKTCGTPPSGAKFWMMSTHAHKQAVVTAVKDGGSTMFTSTDWEHPGAAMFMTPPEFYSFTNGVTYECTYNNPTNNRIVAGQSAATDEMCMAVGYYFPGSRPLVCLNEFGPISP